MAKFNGDISYEPVLNNEALIILERMRINNINKTTQRAKELVDSFGEKLLVKLDDNTRLDSKEYKEQDIIHEELASMYIDRSIRESATDIGRWMIDFMERYVANPKHFTNPTQYEQYSTSYGEENVKNFKEWYEKEDRGS